MLLLKLGSDLLEELLLTFLFKFRIILLHNKRMIRHRFNFETYTLLKETIEDSIISLMDLMVTIQEEPIQNSMNSKRKLMEVIYELRWNLTNIEKELKNIEIRWKMHMQIWEWNMRWMFNTNDILQELKNRKSTSTIKTIVRINNLKHKEINCHQEMLMMLNKTMDGGTELIRSRNQDLKKGCLTPLYHGFMRIQMKKV